MRRYFALRYGFVALVCGLVGIGVLFAYRAQPHSRALVVAVSHDILPANGYAEAKLVARTTNAAEPAGLTWQVESRKNLAYLEQSGPGTRLRAGVTPGAVTLLARAPGFTPTRVTLQLTLDPADQFGDGTPDFLRLDSEDDQQAFRRWLGFLAETTYIQKQQDRPAEINDCAALIRFAYREALRKHDGAWASQWHLLQLPHANSVRKYDYPHTGLGAGLFRIRPGAFAADDISNGAFVEFADAESLRRYNTYFVSRDLHAARPGDLLFFRQQDHRMPFHTMIYLGSSYFGEGAAWLIYHTGPTNGHAGDIRRVTVTELQHHPEFCWRPLPQNPAFLGVYRWNILREED